MARKSKTKSKRGGKFMNKMEKMPKDVVSLGEKGLSTGVGVAQDIGRVGMSVVGLLAKMPYLLVEWV